MEAMLRLEGKAEKCKGLAPLPQAGAKVLRALPLKSTRTKPRAEIPSSEHHSQEDVPS